MCAAALAWCGLPIAKPKPQSGDAVFGQAAKHIARGSTGLIQLEGGATMEVHNPFVNIAAGARCVARRNKKGEWCIYAAEVR